jgi:hypothetical protein
MTEASDCLHMLLREDHRLVQNALSRLEQIRWLTAVAIPVEQLKALQSAAARWDSRTMIDWQVRDVLEHAFATKYGDRAEEIAVAIAESVEKLRIPHHSAIRTCRMYCKSKLVKDWCPNSGDVLEQMVNIYRVGAIVVSDFVIGNEMKILGRAPFAWA